MIKRMEGNDDVHDKSTEHTRHVNENNKQLRNNMSITFVHRDSREYAFVQLGVVIVVVEVLAQPCTPSALNIPSLKPKLLQVPANGFKVPVISLSSPVSTPHSKRDLIRS